MRKATEDNLKAAYAVESQAHMRYQIFSDRAEKENLPNVSRLFRAIAYSERVHATNHYKALGEVKKISDDLQTCIDGEHYEINEMYPAFHEVAKLQDEKSAERSTEWALESEKIHETLYTDAKSAVDGGNDMDIGPVQICEVCGYTVVGEAPDVCPVCKAKKDKFRKF